MTKNIRFTNGGSGSMAILRDPDQTERKFVIFRDAAISDFAIVGDKHAVFLDQYGRAALVNLETRIKEAEFKPAFKAAHVIASPSGDYIALFERIYFRLVVLRTHGLAPVGDGTPWKVDAVDGARIEPANYRAAILLDDGRYIAPATVVRDGDRVRGVVFLNAQERAVDFKPIQNIGGDILAISPDGRDSIAPGAAPLSVPARAKPSALSRVFGRKTPDRRAFALERWNITANPPEKRGQTAYHPAPEETAPNSPTRREMDVVFLPESDRVIVLDSDRIVREISFADGPGPAYRLKDAPPETSMFYWKKFPPDLTLLGGRRFSLNYYGAHVEFDLPESDGFGAHQIDVEHSLAVRVIKDKTRHSEEVAEADRLAAAVRPDRVEIAALDPIEIANGLRTLTEIFRDDAAAVIVKQRWAPSVLVDGEPIDETHYCDILIRDGGATGVAALDGLLTAFVEQVDGAFNGVWHPSGEIPTMGPTANALLVLADPLPESVMRYVAGRDAAHDMWTAGAFEKLPLSDERILKPDILPVLIRLAVQDCEWTDSKAVFEMYKLGAARAALRARPDLAQTFADLIVTQLKLQTADKPWDGEDGSGHLLREIAAALNNDHDGEAALAALLRDRAPAS